MSDIILGAGQLIKVGPPKIIAVSTDKVQFELGGTTIGVIISPDGNTNEEEMAQNEMTAADKACIRELRKLYTDMVPMSKEWSAKSTGNPAQKPPLFKLPVEVRRQLYDIVIN